MTNVAHIRRLTTEGREYVVNEETIDPISAAELVRIFDLIDRAIEDDGGGS